MKMSDKVDAVAPAFMKALGVLPDVKKESFNEFGGYAYAPLEAVTALIRPILAEHHLAMQNEVSCDGHAVVVSTRVWHASGQWIESEPLTVAVEPRKGMTWAQAMGSTITYARRYSMLAFLGIAAEGADNDAAGEVDEKKVTARTRAEMVNNMKGEVVRTDLP